MSDNNYLNVTGTSRNKKEIWKEGDGRSKNMDLAAELDYEGYSPELLLTQWKKDRTLRHIKYGPHRRANPFALGGDVVLAGWESFGSWHPCYNLADMTLDQYYVAGIVIKEGEHQKLVRFSALRKEWTLTADWFQRYALSTVAGRLEITSDFLHSRLKSPKEMGWQKLMAEATLVRCGLQRSTPILRWQGSNRSPLLCGLDDFFDPRRVCCFGDPAAAGSKLGLLNVNGLRTVHNVPAVCWLMDRMALDLLILIDTRVGLNSVRWLRRAVHQYLGPGYGISTTKLVKAAPKIGGITVIGKGEWGHQINQSWSDPSGLGLVFEVVLKQQPQALVVIGTYWPPDGWKADSEQLGAQVLEWLGKRGDTRSPVQYIQDVILERLKRHSGSMILVGGDFNLSAFELREWAFSAGLLHTATHLQRFLPTRIAGASSSQIDHWYGNAGMVNQLWSSDDEAWSVFTDHRPIIIGIPLVNTKQIEDPTSSKPRRVTIGITTERQEQWQQELERIQRSALPMEEKLHVLSTTTVKQRTRPRYSQEMAIWSPAAQGFMIWMRYLLNVKWQRTHVRAWLPSRGVAEARIKGIGEDGEQIWEEICSSCSLKPEEQPHCWNPEKLDREIARMRTKLHTRSRRHLQELYRRATRRRAEAFTSGRTGPIFKQFKEERIGIQLSNLTENGAAIPLAEAPTRLRNHFFRWFSNSNPVGDVDLPLKQEAHLAQAAIATRMRELSFSAFAAMLQHSPRKSAGGPTGLTYDMMRGWTVNTQMAVFELLRKLWEENSIPTWWAKKIIHPIPKGDGCHDIAKLRPIMLLEVSRKIWLKLVKQVVMSETEKANLWEPEQNGFRSGRNVSIGLLQMIAAAEEARARNTKLYFASFDIAKAFDSVPRILICPMLRRMGVPTRLAQYIGRLDEQDSIEITICAELVQPFSASTGVGQGDILSPLIWNSFMDLILSRLKEGTTTDVWISDNLNTVTGVSHSAFADDMFTVTGNIKELQRRASLYLWITRELGLALAASKFRFGITGLRVNEDDYLLIEGTKIVATRKPIKYLGCLLGAEGSASALRAARAYLRAERARFAGRRIEAKIVHLFLQAVCFPKVAYQGQYMSWTMAQCEGLDQIARQTLKEATHLGRTFPSALLYGVKDLGGLGHDSLSETVARRKHKLLLKGLTSPLLESTIRSLASKAGGWYHGLQEFHDRIGLRLQWRKPSSIWDKLVMGGIYRLGHLCFRFFGHEANSWLGEIYCFTSARLTSMRPSVWYPVSPCLGKRFRPKAWLAGAYISLMQSQEAGGTFVKAGGELQHVDGAEECQECSQLSLTPLRGPGIVCTDGSFAVTHQSMAGYRIRQGAAFVVVDPSRTNRSSVLAQPLIPRSLHNSGAFTMEVMAVLMAVLYTRDMNVYSDSKATVTLLKADLQMLVTHSHGLLLILIKKLLGPRQILWVPAHMDRSVLVPDLTLEQLGNTFADSVAGGTREANVLLRENDIIYEAVALARLPYWVAGSCICITSETTRIGYSLHRYLNYEGSHESCRRAFHKLVKMQLLGEVLKPYTSSQKGARLKLYLGLFQYDRLAAEEKMTACVCGCSNSLVSWISTCLNTAVIQHRQEVISELHELIGPRRQLWKIDELEGTERMMLLRGHWPDKWDHVSPYEYKRAVLGILRAAMQGALGFYTLARRQSSGLVPLMKTEAPQRKITDFFSTITNTPTPLVGARQSIKGIGPSSRTTVMVPPQKGAETPPGVSPIKGSGKDVLITGNTSAGYGTPSGDLSIKGSKSLTASVTEKGGPRVVVSRNETTSQSSMDPRPK